MRIYAKTALMQYHYINQTACSKLTIVGRIISVGAKEQNITIRLFLADILVGPRYIVICVEIYLDLSTAVLRIYMILLLYVPSALESLFKLTKGLYGPLFAAVQILSQSS
jgi:hypothetical protein